jgi:hypothetical protein
MLVLAYLIYGLGFLLRTEAHIETLRDDPGILMTEKGFKKLRNMREDYQVIAPLIQNPIFPIEPIATYGKILNTGHRILSRFGELSQFEADIMQWKNVSDSTSIFPLLNEVFSWLTKINPDIQSLSRLVESQVSGFGDSAPLIFWNNFQKNRDIWYTILGKK